MLPYEGDHMQIFTLKEIKTTGIVGLTALTIASCAGGGLTTREKTTLGGAALGAGAGALIGEAAGGKPGKGALIGGAIGGLGGALTGSATQSRDQELYEHERELERQRYEAERQRRELEDLRRDRYYDREVYRDPYERDSSRY
jgi:uncharacterized protein YcfJ